MADRNFDDIADKFSQNIYHSIKGEIRKSILWQDLSTILEKEGSPSLTVLDAGGGEGILSCKLAELGHSIYLCDISEKMIAQAQQRTKELQLTERIQFFQCSVETIEQFIPQVDLVLSHAVLEWVDEPKQMLAALSRNLKPNGILSLMFYNYNALLFRNIQLGNIHYINAGMQKKKRRSLSPDHPLLPEQVYQWLEQLNFHLLIKSGVRVFNDYLIEKPKDKESILQLEKQFCRQEPFLSLGRYIHVMAQKINK